MASPTEIEKKSLEAHVELCAQRYLFLEEKLETVEAKVSGVKTTVEDLHDMLGKVIDKRNDQLINWGVGIIAALTTSLVWIIIHYVLK